MALPWALLKALCWPLIFIIELVEGNLIHKVLACVHFFTLEGDAIVRDNASRSVRAQWGRILNHVCVQMKRMLATCVVERGTTRVKCIVTPRPGGYP